MKKLARTVRTVAHMRPVQVTNRITRRFAPRVDLSGAGLPLRRPSGEWNCCPGRKPSMIGPSRVVFLSQEKEIGTADAWNDPRCPKLWLYHLHYFDDLLADGAASRIDWQRDLIARWMAENPPPLGNGWEPYPISRRVVNWIGWALGGHDLVEEARASLVRQTRVLVSRLEYHLLGNHLFANAKALVFAGCFFAGEEADEWLRLGLAILKRELDEQILADGAHFELSPMYHALTLEDLVDLLQLSRIYPDLLDAPARQQRWAERIGAMAGWLAAMCHPDGDIAFFNDATFEQARSPADIFAYAGGLGVEAHSITTPLVHLPDSGYMRLAAGPWTAIFDAGHVGPGYLPGHAHADTLSLEIAVGEERLVTNSGTSTYAIGAQRDAERATRAHATVELDGENSSEVWASFRVGRRARPLHVSAGVTGAHLWGEAAHDGYRFLSGKPLHRRRVEVSAGGVIIRDDVVRGSGHQAVGRLPLHPSIVVVRTTDDGWLLRTSAGRRIRVQVRGADSLHCEEGTFAPRFGHVEPRPVLIWRSLGERPHAIETEIAL